MSWIDALKDAPLLVETRERLARERVELSGALGPAGLLVALLATDAPRLVLVPRERDVERVMGGNLLRLYREVIG